MGVPANVVRIVTYGTLSAEPDIWNVVMHCLADTEPDASGLDEIAANVLAAWTAHIFSGTPGAQLSTYCAMDGVKAYSLDAEGHALAMGLAVPDGGSPTGSAATGLPMQLAVCVSLNTARPGRSYQGRSYLAGLAGEAVSASGLLTEATTLIFANAFAAMMSEVNASTYAGGEGLTLGVLSKLKTNIQDITHVRVGNIVDTQRRRRNAVAEAYSVAAVTE